jgi:hypothetical protein
MFERNVGQEPVLAISARDGARGLAARGLFFVQEGFEFRPGLVLTDKEYATAKRFECLHDDVDEIPQIVLEAAESLIAKIEAAVFERHLQSALAAVGDTSFPNSAKEFCRH